jgi:hypothetical protein
VTLRRPEGVSDKHWEAIEAHEARLDGAVQRADFSGVVGAAKELCECVARVICAERAQTLSTSDDFGKTILTAHDALDRRPGRGAAVEMAVREMAQTAREMMTKLSFLRNELGTGHGRSILPVVTRETAAMAEQSARLWSTWALARLDEVLRGEVPGLVQELERGLWHRGLLAQRFAEVGLDSLHSEDQHRLGVAVAHRSSGGGTFVVRQGGIEPLESDGSAWPASYRAGVAAGLMIDSLGRFALIPQYVRVLSTIVSLMELEEWRQLSEQAASAPLDVNLRGDNELRQQLADEMMNIADTLDGHHRAYWLELSKRVRNEEGEEG